MFILQRVCARFLLYVALLSIGYQSARAHEVPRTVVVRAFVQPSGHVLRVLVRVPLDAMRDVDFPLRGAGYLDLTRADSLLRDAAKLWVVDGIALYEGDVLLRDARIVTARAALASDMAYRTYESALHALRSAPMATSTDVPWKQAMLDVLIEYPIASATAKFSMQPALAHLGVRTTTVLRFLSSTGTERAFEYEGDPGVVALDPGWWQTAMRFVRAGFVHILSGLDHLLFLLCLVIPIRRMRQLVGVVTSFTVAHSITLIASAAGYAPDALWFPPLIEVLIALSIVYMALENIIGAKLQRRWLIAFGFGLVHGFGFSFSLRETLQFAGSHLYTSLAAFNIGVELGQLAVLAVAVPVLTYAFRKVVAERMGTIILSALVAHTAWHWMLDRGATLSQYTFVWPVVDALFVANIMRAAAILMGLGVVVWVLAGVMRRLTPAAAVTSSTSLFVCIALAASTSAPRAVRAQRAATHTLAKPAAATPTLRSTRAGVYTADQAVKGREVFLGACTGCHTPAAHTGAVFAKWAGRPLSEYYGYVSHLMPKAAPGTLSEDEYVWVIAYLLKVNGMPAGAEELSADETLLKGVRIDTKLGAGRGAIVTPKRRGS